MTVLSSYDMDRQRHTFSHYHLDYTPLVVLTDSGVEGVSESGDAQWHRIGSIDRLGVAAPIKRLLKQYQIHEDKNDKTG